MDRIIRKILLSSKYKIRIIESNGSKFKYRKENTCDTRCDDKKSIGRSKLETFIAHTSDHKHLNQISAYEIYVS